MALDSGYFEVSKAFVSNGDRIRAMTDEELAELLEWHGLCEHIKDNYYELCETRGVCGGCVLNWLKQPAEVENDT